MPEESKPPAPEHRGPTETLVSCLEEFGESEPERVLVIWVNEAGDLCWSTNGPYKHTHIIGMLDCVKARVMQRFLAAE
jgi:hypothetical protein